MEYLESLNGVKAVCVFIPFTKDNFTIAKFKVLDDNIKNQLPSPSVTVKGNFGVDTGDVIYINGALEENKSYPGTYKGSVSKFKDISEVISKNPMQYLSTVVSDSLAKSITDTVADPIQALECFDVETLMLADGVGQATAERLINEYHDNKDTSYAMSVLVNEFGMTKQKVRDICMSPLVKGQEQAVKMAKDNVYQFANIKGIGFKTADAYFLQYNMKDHNAYKSPLRVEAYIEYMFKEEFNKRNTWLTPKQIALNVRDFIPDADLDYVVKVVNDRDKYVKIKNGDEHRISTKWAFRLEAYVGKRLRQMVMIENEPIESLESVIKSTEVEQGFSYTSEQIDAINTGVNNNVFLLQGPAGTGKSSTAKGIVNVLRSQGMTIAGCALSGRAAKNLSDITQNEGSTIHKLLGLGSSNPYNENNKMPYDVIILDEISMVSLDIYYKLLKAMKDDARIIMLGDNSQLPSIGAGVANGLFYSSAIPKYNLAQIHRQAQKSGIITHSLAVRNGFKNPELKLEEDTDEVYGELEDIKYSFVKKEEEEKIVAKSIKEYSSLVEKFGLDNVLIITPTRKNMTKLNKYAQLSANPPNEDKVEIKVTVNNSKKELAKQSESDYNVFEDENVYTLRVGDRIVNIKNNYKTKDDNGDECPIFNGNTGKVLEIENKKIIINFDGVGNVVIPKESFSDIRLGYAVTVHSVQGLTIRGVVIALPFQFMLNTRGLLYTALTRASKFCSVITSPKTLMHTINKDDKITEQTNLKLILDYKKG